MALNLTNIYSVRQSVINISAFLTGDLINYSEGFYNDVFEYL
jgi:hypothetical protein